MNLRASTVAAMMLAILPITVSGFEKPDSVPAECEKSLGAVALLDCLQVQHDILQAILEYQELLTRIEQAKSERTNVTLAPPAAAEEPQQEEALIRANWFDENLQVYAIVGKPQQMTAYARLNGHEYRLQEGDVIRLAKVAKIHTRGIELSVSGYLMSIGISGLPSRND